MSLHSSAIPTKLMWKKYLKAVQNVDKIFENLTKMYGTCTKCGQNVWNLYKDFVTKCGQNVWNLNTGNDVASVEPCSQLETFVRPVGHNKPSTLGQN